MARRAPRIDDRDLIKELTDAMARGALGLGDSCRFMRASRGLTQAEFASELGVALKVIKEIEAGKGNPTLASLNRLAQAAGLRIGLVQGEPTIQLGIEEIVAERREERLGILRDLKQGTVSAEDVHARNALSGSSFEIGIPKLS